MRFFAAAGSDDAAQSMLDFVNATADILRYATAISAADLPVIIEAPTWYGAFQGQWVEVKSHALTWINALAPSMNATINSIVAFNTLILGLIQTAQTDIGLLVANPNDPELKKNLLSTLNEILTLLAQMPTEIDGFFTMLAGFRSEIADDQVALQDAVTDANASVGADNDKIKQFTNDIANLQASIDKYNQILFELKEARDVGIFIAALGCAVAVVSGGAGAGIIGVGVVLIGATALGDLLLDKAIADANDAIAADNLSIGDVNAQITVLNHLMSQLGTLSDQNGVAQSAAATLKTFWDTLSADVAAFLAAIQTTESDTDYTKAQNDIAAAITEWNALETFLDPLSTIAFNVAPKPTMLPKAA